ncbi:hypothetical protein D9615_000978 [Tricholomella constricta]|uniref:C2H2-type domain-containing protein n=1 Tax=Tricholomella constricta TaxID=117010 RepID=A0A8H5HKV6_9AGAR|nr:hypothetical protein D9615_000978 [Tricholomella constricta]
MLLLNFSCNDISPDSSSRPFNSNIMSEPVSPTYTSYSVPSPFSSGSSASYPNRSPVSDAFDAIVDSDHHQHHHPSTMEDYAVGYPPTSSSLPVYSELGYITPQDFDYNMVNWSSPELVMTAKRQPLPAAPQHPQHFHQQSSYRSVPSQDLPSEVERLKNLALYIPPTSPVTFHQQQQHSPAVIHSPAPIPVPSNVPSHHSPSIASHSPHTAGHPLQHSHRVHHQSQEQYFDVDVDEWRSSPTTTHHAQYPPAYTHSQPHSVAMTQPYQALHGDLSQAPAMRRTVSGYSTLSNNGLRVKQEDMDMYATLGRYNGQSTHSPRQAHIFDLSAKPSVPTHSPHMQPPPLSPSYYSRPHADQTQQQQHQTYAIHPAELSPTEPCVPHAGFDAPPADVGYNTDMRYDQPGYGTDSGYVDVCDPQFVSGCGPVDKGELVDPGRESDLDDGWEARRRCLEAEYAEAAAAAAAGEQQEQTVVADDDADADADADADGEDDLEAGYSSQEYPSPPQQPTDVVSQRGDSPDPHQELKRRAEVAQQEDDEDEIDDEELESEDDDSRDPEFVLRPRRHTSTSYPYTEGRHLRSTRYNPYPSYSSASPTGRYPDDYQSQQYSSQPLRSRRSYSHTSVSPSASETYAPLSAGTNMPRRRSRPTTTLPIPVPVPNLTKKSRGRRVPTMEDFQGEDEVQPPTKVPGRKKGAAGAVAKGLRTYTCDVDGCGKLFARGEHLKRHIRSIHTYEKPHRCPYPGCGKDFSRHDNLGQHMRVHKDYVPPKDGQSGYKA